VAVGALAGQGHEEIAGLHLPRVHRSATDRSPGEMQDPAASGGGELGRSQGELPRAEPRLRLAGVGHRLSVAQPVEPGARHRRHPSGVDFLDPGGSGPFGLGGIPSVATASVAMRRNSS